MGVSLGNVFSVDSKYRLNKYAISFLRNNHNQYDKMIRSIAEAIVKEIDGAIVKIDAEK